MTFFDFLADLTLTDWLLLLVAWLIIATAMGVFTGKGIARADAAARVTETDGSLAELLPEWVNDRDEPLYVPREWVA